MPEGLCEQNRHCGDQERQRTWSGTGVTAISLSATAGAAATEASKSSVPPAPTVKFDPEGKASTSAISNIPPLTVVPPV